MRLEFRQIAVFRGFEAIFHRVLSRVNDQNLLLSIVVHNNPVAVIVVVVIIVVVVADLVDDDVRASALFLMRRAVAAITEGPATSGASERPLTGMSPQVRVEDVLVSEKPVTVRARVHVLAGMHVQVASDVVS